MKVQVIVLSLLLFLGGLMPICARLKPKISLENYKKLSNFKQLNKLDTQVINQNIDNLCNEENIDNFVANEIIVKYKKQSLNPNRNLLEKTKLKLDHKISSYQLNYSLKRAFDNSSISNTESAIKVELQTTNKLRRGSRGEAAVDSKYGFDRIYLVLIKEPSFLLKDLPIDSKVSNCQKLQGLIKELNADPDVEYAEPNYLRKLQTTSVNDLHYQNGYLWGIDKIQAPEAWDFSKGDEVLVAVIDSGVDYNHPDLWDNMWVNPKLVPDRNDDGKITLDDADLNHNKYIEATQNYSEVVYSGDEEMLGYDFVDYNIPYDEHGHGTHVSGTIAAKGDNSIGVVGVAFNATIVPLKILNENGFGNVISSINAVLKAIDLNARIINGSYGSGSPSQTEASAYQAAYNSGIVSIVAAGNDGVDASTTYPAAYSSTIAVGATDINDERTSFSNYGSTVDIAAPGEFIISTMGNFDSSASNPSEFISTENQEFGYWTKDGTSMASPHVAGVVALIFGYDSSFSRSDAYLILSNAVDVIDTDRPIGIGRINASKAMSASLELKALYAIDTNRNRDITYQEMVTYLWKIRKLQKGGFTSTVDIDKNNQNEASDFAFIQEVIEAYNYDISLNTPQMQKAFAAIDTNADGLITKKERTKFKNNFNLIKKKRRYKANFDMDEDGKITSTDASLIKQIYSNLSIKI